MRVAWHPSWWWNWCVPEDEKKVTEKLWVQAFFLSDDQIQIFFLLKRNKKDESFSPAFGCRIIQV